jgi:tetratricopeptide (TPR) repeat protein
MRVALVIAPPQDPAAEPPSPVVHLRERLALSGFNVVNLATSPSLPSQVADAASIADEDDSVLLYIAARTRLDDDGTVRIAARGARGEGDETIPLSPIGEVLRAQRPREVFYFVEVEHDGMADDVMRAAEHVDAIATALGVREAQHGLLVGAHALVEGAPDWPLTRFYLELLDDTALRDEHGDLPASRVYDKVREDADLAVRVPSYALLKGATDFALHAAPILTPTPSKRPPTSSMLPPPSELHRSLRPIALPALDPILAAATEARAKQQWERALDEYKKALMIVPAEDATAKASIYAYLGEVKRAQGKPREAELNFEKALREVPGHRRSLEALVAIATEGKEWGRVVEHRRAFARATADPFRRSTEYLKIAGLCENELGDKEGAAKALEEAREALPRDVGLLQKLRKLYEELGMWPKVADVLGAMSDVESAAPHARAALRFQQADVTLARLRDEPRGLALLEKALEDDPMHEKALFALIAVRTRREEHKELERALVALTERLARAHELNEAADVCKRLAVLRRDKLRDGPGAIDAYQGALKCRPFDADARAMLAELLIAKGDVDEAARELEEASRYLPTRPATYKRLFELHTRAGRADRSWLAAIALTELGAAEMDHELAVDQF